MLHGWPMSLFTFLNPYDEVSSRHGDLPTSVANLRALSAAALPSVVIFRLKDMRSHNINRYLAAILEQHSSLLEQGVIFSVNERRTRVRRLPIRK